MGLELVLELVAKTPKTQNRENLTFLGKVDFLFCSKTHGFSKGEGPCNPFCPNSV